MVRRMYAAADTIKDFERNRRLIRSQAEGLDHSQSLLQPSGGNCFNWVLGHIVVHRDKVISACGARPVMDADQTARYENESDPIIGDGKDVVAFDTLLELLDASQERLVDAVSNADLMEMQSVGDRHVPLWKRIHFWYFHDTYHAGQTELLRGLAGFTDRVI
jgi:hypothetical protein